MRPNASQAAGRRPLVWSSTAVGTTNPDPDGVRLSRLGRLLHRASTRRFLLFAGDVAAAVGAVTGALWSWSALNGLPLTWQYLQDRGAWFALAGVWLLLLQPASAARRGFSTRDAATIVTRVALTGIGLYLAIYFLAPRDLLPRLVVLNFLGLAGVATLVWRVVYGQLFAEDTRQRPVAVVGTGPAARDVAALLRELAPHRPVLGLFPSHAPPEPAAPGASLAPLKQLVTQRRISALILAPEAAMGGDVLRTVVAARERDIDVVPMHTLYEQLLRRLPIRHKEPAWVFESLANAGPRHPTSWAAKRTMDIAGAVIGCTLLLLSLPILGPLIWMDVGWPVFFRQERLGLAGASFRMLKFRTMGPDAERDGPRWAEAEDARASRFGRFLRRSRLDELPQFWNVLRGEMSLVGPRPERPEFVAELAHRIPCYRARLLIRPGISGWAQVNYRYGGSMDGALDKLEYDLYYIKHRGFWLDAAIVARTIGTVLALGGR